MRALVFHGVRDLRYEDAATPAVGSGEALVKVKAVGICGSDVHGYLGKTGRRIPPMIMGHEFSGVVERVGPGPTDVNPGDRVAVFPYTTCGRCSYCQDRRINACPDKRFLGVFSTNGAMAQYVSVPAELLVPLPADVSFVHGALGEPLSVAARVVSKAYLGPEAAMTIIGAGTIGLMCLILAKTRGARCVSVIDISEDRLRLAKRLGADLTLNAGSQDPAEILPVRFEQRGPAVVIEAVGIEATVNQAVQLVARGGTLVIVGMSDKRMVVDMHEIVGKEIRIEGSFLYGRQEFHEVLGQVRTLTPQLDMMVSHTAPLSEGAAFFERLAKAEPDLFKIILTD
jgi:L-iditol 2-dehydrogenase